MRYCMAVAVALSLASSLVAQVLPAAFTPLAPCRILDTRSGDPVVGGSTVYLDVRGVCNVPEEANAITFSVAAWQPLANGSLLVWEDGILRPTATTLNYQAVSNAMSSGGVSRLCYPLLECINDLQIWSSQETDVILDVTGYYSPLTDLIPE